MAKAFVARKFKDDETVVCIESFATEGVADVIVQGARLRGDHLAVRKNPHLFIRDGASSEELQAQREAVLYKPQIEAIEKADRAQREEWAKHQPPPIPLERRLRVKQGFRQGLGRTFAEGEIVDRDDPAVAKVIKEAPQFLEIPGRPLAT